LRASTVRSTVWTLEWTATDPDGDELIYELKYRPADSPHWIPIGGPGKQFLTAALRWNTDSIPDGKYFLRVTASDERGNPPSEAIRTDRDWGPFTIDNGRPEVKISESVGGKIRGMVSDTTSLLTRLEYRVDGGDWKKIQPKDGVLDGQSEEWQVQLDLKGLEPGVRTITIRAIDEKDNVGVATVQVRAGE
jgi:hypothetical protein